MKRTKVFAAYLPQFHEIEENNKFWGKGFTDWVAVKSAKPLFAGHNQPQKPLNEEYYDLSDPCSIEKQAQLANQFGIDGFNIYHYWFQDGHAVLQKPAELILQNKNIEIEYFFSWDNCSWKRSWSNISGNDWTTKFEPDMENEKGSPYLLKLDYGNQEQWRQHFDYLLPFFKDSRYLKIDNSPVFMFFTNTDIKSMKKMGECWKEWAKESGFSGLFLVQKKVPFFRYQIFDAEFFYQPIYAAWMKRRAVENRIKRYLPFIYRKKKGPFIYEYERVWKKIYSEAKKNIKKNCIIGSFVGYDDTPRRGEQGTVIVNQSVDIFKEYFEKLYKLCCKNECDIMLITAWNEWGEGAFLEPDMINEYNYLNVIKEVKNYI